MKPMPTTRLDLIFGGDMRKFLPPWETLPREFQQGDTKWNRVASRWFFSGLPKGTIFSPKAGIDVQEALRHLAAILASFEPKQEHKEAGVAYLMSLWFYDIEIPGRHHDP